ncbi:hypothetical protein HJG60_011983 [Phyllostomus discolor]|uniref:Uncharacterized protein n=1 Tax=Phyllostomus discolor TaxID=89673 RepID=A0A833ZLT3_9CHIR|nr:hypothetical protein HJG60_011983 [Phyllostomus discolor]
MGSSPATVAKGRPGSCSAAAPAMQTLAGFSEDHMACCGQTFEDLWPGLGRGQGIPVAILGPICVPCFVIGRWAVLAPPAATAFYSVLLQMRSMFPKLRRAIRNYVPTSERCSTKLWLLLVLPLVFLQLCALAGSGKGQPSLMWAARALALVPWCTHEPMHTRGTLSSKLCVSGEADSGSTGCFLLGARSLNSLLSCLSALQETKVPVPCGCPALPVCLSARGQLQVWLSIAGIPTTCWPPGCPVGELSQKGPFGAEVERRQTVLKNHPYYPKRNISVEGFPLQL